MPVRDHPEYRGFLPLHSNRDALSALQINRDIPALSLHHEQRGLPLLHSRRDAISPLQINRDTSQLSLYIPLRPYYSRSRACQRSSRAKAAFLPSPRSGTRSANCKINRDACQLSLYIPLRPYCSRRRARQRSYRVQRLISPSLEQRRDQRCANQ